MDVVATVPDTGAVDVDAIAHPRAVRSAPRSDAPHPVGPVPADGPMPGRVPRRKVGGPSLGGASLGPATAIGAERPGGGWAGLVEVDGRTVMWFEVGGTGTDRDATAEAHVVERALRQAGELQVPVLGIVDSLAVTPDDLSGLIGWGRVARAATALSGSVPILLAVTGPCPGGLTPILGLADHVVVTTDALAYVNGPAAVARVTGATVDPEGLGGAAVHARETGLASLVASDRADAEAALADLLTYLPSAWDAPLPPVPTSDPGDRPNVRAVAAVPTDPRASYDVRDVLTDVADEGSLLEVWADHAPNLVTAYARLGGRAVALIANQPRIRAGTLDIAASSKAARHVQAADAAGLPLVTFVDTPGFEPGMDLEWRGMIRHGAELVYAYCEATVPRICVILRKSYGGAYIVMDSREIGSDLVLAWPTAEIAVMGAPGAVAILNRREIAAADDPDRARAALEAEYQTRFCTPAVAADRGYVDQVIDPSETRAHLTAALARLAAKRPRLVARRHGASPC